MTRVFFPRVMDSVRHPNVMLSARLVVLVLRVTVCPIASGNTVQQLRYLGNCHSQNRLLKVFQILVSKSEVNL